MRNPFYGEPGSREGSREFQNQEEKPPTHPPPPSPGGDARIPAALGALAVATGQGPPSARTTRSHAHTTSWHCPWRAERGGSCGHSVPDPAEPWPHGVASACPAGWTRRPLTWSRKFLLPRGPNTACPRAHSATGEMPQAARPFSQGQGARGEGVRLISQPWVPRDLLDLQEHLQRPGSKIQG